VLAVAVLAVGLGGAAGVFLLLERRRNASGAAALTAVAALDHSPAAPTRFVDARDDAAIPRWLRASLREERAWTPPREPATRSGQRRALSFEEPLGESAMRLVVRYDRVELLDEPNEAYAQRLTEVGTGDEVEILDLADSWALVRTPLGHTGWLPTMTIGARPFEPDPPDEPAAEPQTPSRPAGRRLKRRATTRSQSG
jgi:hypothetical protein